MEPPKSLRSQLWAAGASLIKAKELQESCAFYDCIRKDVRKMRPERVVDVCGGHGALAMLVMAQGLCSEALVVDPRQPPSHARLRDAWAKFLPGPVSFDQRPLQQALPEVLCSEKRTLVVACHACQHLAREIMDQCLKTRTAFAVCPCCQKDHAGSLQAAAKSLEVDFASAMILAEMGRLSAQGCHCVLRRFDAKVSPQNCVLLGRPEEEKKGNEERAEERLQRAYDRAHHSSSSDGRAAGLWCEEHELEKKRAALQCLLAPLTGEPIWEHLEIRESPPRHFRARTVVAVGGHAQSGGLFRLSPDAGGYRLECNMPVETLLPQLAAALPALAELLRPPLSLGLRCVKLHGTLGTKQLSCCLVYGPEAELPSPALLAELRAGLGDRLELEVLVMASAKGRQCSVPEGRDWVEELLEVPGRGKVRYRQPFGQFSNPNPHIAIATAQWLGEVLQDVAGPGMDLLELYCGCGSHTVVLAPFVRHVLAVEINRHLVDAAQHNVELNGLTNVTVLRAPSEDFSSRLLRRRSYELRCAGDAEASLRLDFGCTVVDPPRAGLDEVTLRAVAGYAQVLYVSCNPVALKSNLEVLLKTHELRRMVLLDHFPCSQHVEMAVHLSKR